MKKFLLTLAPICALALLSFNVGEPLAIGSKLPEAKFPMMDISTGYNITIKEAAKSNGVLVMFSSNGCTDVIKNITRTKEIAAYAKANDIGFIMINSNEAQRDGADSYEAMKVFYEQEKYTWSYVLDAKSVLANAFGATRTPECFLFNSSLSLVYHGAIDDSPADATLVSTKYLKDAMDVMLTGKEVKPATSNVVGCAIATVH